MKVANGTLMALQASLFLLAPASGCSGCGGEATSPPRVCDSSLCTADAAVQVPACDSATCVAEGSNGLKLGLASPTYAQGEQIAIAIRLTNTTTSACEMPGIPDGFLAVTSMTRDARPVLPSFTTASYTDGLTGAIVGHLVRLAPGDTTSMTWLSHTLGAGDSRRTLETITVGPGDVGNVSRWLVDKPGSYQVTLNYRVPPMDSRAPSDVCGFSDTATISFVVREGN